MGVADSLRFEASMAKFKMPAARATLTDVMQQLAPQIADYRAKGYKWKDIATGLSEALGESGKHLKIDEGNLRATWSQKDEFAKWRVRAAEGAATAPYVSDAVRRQYGDSLREAMELIERQRASFEIERTAWDEERSEIEAGAGQAIQAWKLRHDEMEHQLGSMRAQWNNMRYELGEERKKVQASNGRWRSWAAQIHTCFIELQAARNESMRAAEAGDFAAVGRLDLGEIPRLLEILLSTLSDAQKEGFAP